MFLHFWYWNSLVSHFICSLSKLFQIIDRWCFIKKSFFCFQLTCKMFCNSFGTFEDLFIYIRCLIDLLPCSSYQIKSWQGWSTVFINMIRDLGLINKFIAIWAPSVWSYFMNCWIAKCHISYSFCRFWSKLLNINFTSNRM